MISLTLILSAFVLLLAIDNSEAEENRQAIPVDTDDQSASARR